MKKARYGFICLAFVLIPGLLFGGEKPVRFSDIQVELESAIGKLSSYIDIFENLQSKKDASARANQNYNEQKNIFLSSQMAIDTITVILAYNRDLLILFGDLKEKNRKKFYAVRIESLETSVKQIKNMHQQIEINYTILPLDFFKQASINTERDVILSAIASLETCVALLKSVNQR